MDIKITNDGPGGPSLEYNVIGGVIDFYFLVGSETDPTAVAKQYASVVGRPAEIPYWSIGFHQCRFGYKSKFSLPGYLELPLNIIQTLLMWQTSSPGIKQQKFHWKLCGQISVRCEMIFFEVDY